MTATATDTRAIRPAPDEFAPYYGRYIDKVPDGDIVATLRNQVGDTLRAFRAIPDAKAGHRYAPDKWSIREVVGHLSDAERIFTYRALRIARGVGCALRFALPGRVDAPRDRERQRCLGSCPRVDHRGTRDPSSRDSERALPLIECCLLAGL